MPNKINLSLKVSKAREFKNSKQRLLVGAAILSVLSVGVSSGAYAQAAGDDTVSGFGEIIVTAQRREQSLQDVPIAVTALGADAIQRSDISDISRLEGQVPGLTIANGAERTNISIRGVGSLLTNIAGEAGVPVNVDGVYMTRTTLSGATYGDLAQIEVLRGPQGTLYGRNATAGTVNINTKTPDGSTSGEVSALVGNADRFRLRGAVGIPLAGDALSARVSMDYETLGGYRNNLFLDEKADPEDHISGRGVLRWAPQDNLEVILRASVSSDDVGGPIIQYGTAVNPARNPLLFGGLTSVDPRNINNNQRTRAEYDDQIYSGTLIWDFGGMTLKSVTAYQDHDFTTDFDGEGTSFPFSGVNLDEESSAWTQEVTLGGSSSKLDWVVGAWLMEDDASAFSTFTFGPVFTVSYDQETSALALFGQATYSLTDSLRATAGLRYSDETKKFVQDVRLPPVPCSGESTKKYDDLSPKFGLDYDLSDSVLVYASATKGFKAGGANLASCGSTYDPETIWAYEGGIKSQWFDDRVRLNLNGYMYDYKDLQLSKLGDTATLITSNAADAEVRGLELEFGFRPTSNLSFDLGMAVSDSEFLEYIITEQVTDPSDPGRTIDLAGNQLPVAPKFSGNAAVEYQAPVGSADTLTLRAERQWSSEIFYDAYNANFTRQKAYSISNARIAYGFGDGSLEGLEASLFVKNIEDKDILNRADYGGIFGGTRVAYQRPRTFGTELRYRFGQ